MRRREVPDRPRYGRSPCTRQRRSVRLCTRLVRGTHRIIAPIVPSHTDTRPQITMRMPRLLIAAVLFGLLLCVSRTAADENDAFITDEDDIDADESAGFATLASEGAIEVEPHGDDEPDATPGDSAAVTMVVDDSSEPSDDEERPTKRVATKKPHNWHCGQ